MNNEFGKIVEDISRLPWGKIIVGALMAYAVIQFVFFCPVLLAGLIVIFAGIAFMKNKN